MQRHPIVPLICTCWLIATALSAFADESVLRVATSGDYSPFSSVQVSGQAVGIEAESVGKETPPREHRFDGLDPEIARAFAKDRGLSIRFVPFRWPELLSDLAEGRFDVAMSGITVRPERSLAGRFSVPVATSGAVVLAPVIGGLETPADLRRPGLRVAVNAGGHLERVTRGIMPSAHVVAVPSNADVLAELAAGRVDVVMTDSREAPHWEKRLPGLRRIGPLTRDRKAYLVAPDRPELARDLDAWLLDAEATGRLAALRARWLGAESKNERSADPLSAALAAIDERLALMPLVAEAKRLSGSPIEAPERELRVIDAALEAVRTAGAETGRTPPEPSVRALFRAQIEVAKTIQRRTLAAPPADPSVRPPDLATELRPALIGIGDRLAWLLVRLPADTSRESIRIRAAEALTGRALAPADTQAIGDALHGVCCASAQ